MLVDTIFTFSAPNLIKFGKGAIDEISYEVKRLGGSKPLIVTDEGVRDAKILDKVKLVLENAGLEVNFWDQVEPEPSLKNYEQCYESARGRGFDVVIGVGGGSSIDVGKTVRMLLKHGGDVLDYIGKPIGGGKKFSGPGLPYIAVPTTAGTGSECTPAAVIRLPEEKLRVGIRDRFMRPEVALVDPMLTVTLPPDPTASTGIDALSHAIEVYTCRRYNCREKPATPEERPIYVGSSPMTDAFCYYAMELIGRYLMRAVNNGYDLEAREGMSLASLLQGIGVSNAGVALAHAIASPLGGIVKAPHGKTVSAVLPYVMAYNEPAIPERFAHIAKLLGGDSKPGFSQRGAAAKILLNLIKDLGLPSSLPELGIKEDQLPQLAEATIKSHEFLSNNPRKVTINDLNNIIKKAYYGQI
jgi:alcohol dehydrogenase class IV